MLLRSLGNIFVIAESANEILSQGNTSNLVQISTTCKIDNHEWKGNDNRLQLCEYLQEISLHVKSQNTEKKQMWEEKKIIKYSTM